MTIGRIEFEGGHQIDLNSHSLDFARKLAQDNIQNLRFLPESEYILGSSHGKNLKHNLVVFKDGTGIYRGMPLNRNVGLLEHSPEGTKDFRTGGKTVHFPEDTSFTVILGAMEDGNLGIYEIIFHIHGPSPKTIVNFRDLNQS